MVRRVTALIVGQLGIESVQVDNGKTALETWRQGDFTAFLLDQHVPEIDGEAVTHAIRATERASHRARTPIIGLVADDAPEDRQACLVAGMDDVLTTPITIGEMRRVLGNWMLVKDGIAIAQEQH